MGFIYKITNQINQKSYIGKTERNVSVRWSEHKKNRNQFPNLPLYRALNKYGVENFTIDIIEECPTDILDDREIYWINHYNTYQGEGYNCTGGGEGGIINFDDDLKIIIERYQQGERLDRLCKEYHHDYNCVKNKMIEQGVEINTHAGPMKNAKMICACNPQTEEIIKIYNSISEAGRDLCEEGKNPRAISNNISVVIDKSRIRYGYKWKKYKEGE